MARIPQELLERIKGEILIERLAERAGVVLKPHGADLVGLCPRHDDREPSLVVTPSKGLFHCFGCGRGGSVIDWVMWMEGVSFRHAVEILRAEFFPLAAGVTSSPEPVKRSTSVKLASPVELDAEDEELKRDVVTYYHGTFKESPEAKGYVAWRGLDSSELIERFKFGFANRTLGYRLPAKCVKSGEEIRGRLQKLGFIRASGHEFFNGSVVTRSSRRRARS